MPFNLGDQTSLLLKNRIFKNALIDSTQESIHLLYTINRHEQSNNKLSIGYRIGRM